MNRGIALCLVGWALTVAATPAGAAGCQTVEDVAETFLDVYPTGGYAGRFDDAHGDQIMRDLVVGGDGDEVVFLYSGDGPTTGARGRYMYLILDSEGCVLDRDWIDGKIFDRVRS